MEEQVVSCSCLIPNRPDKAGPRMPCPPHHEIVYHWDFDMPNEGDNRGLLLVVGIDVEYEGFVLGRVIDKVHLNSAP